MLTGSSQDSHSDAYSHAHDRRGDGHEDTRSDGRSDALSNPIAMSDFSLQPTVPNPRRLPPNQPSQTLQQAYSGEALTRSVAKLEQAVSAPELTVSEIKGAAAKSKRRKNKPAAEAQISRDACETPQYLGIAKMPKNIMPLSAAEYIEAKGDVDAMGTVYVCGPADARAISDASPVVPIVIRTEGEAAD